MYGVQNIETLQKIDGWEDDIFADYGGSDRKCGVISPDGKRYLVKYAETHMRKNALDTSYVNNVLAEYLSSHILAIAGYSVHHTFLATCGGELVVCCENFTSEDEKLIEFGRFLRKYYDSGEVGRVPELSQIRYVFRTDRLLSSQETNLWRAYWEGFVGDALTGNFDRHMGNFGYLVSRNGVRLSPVYDNGSTLFPALSERAMQEDILPSKKEILKRALLFPKAALTINGQKVRYYDMLASDYVPELSETVRIRVPEIRDKMPEIYAFIDRQECLSEIRKRFYKTMLTARYEYVIRPAWERCESGEYDKAAYARIDSGENYTEEMFEQEYERAAIQGEAGNNLWM